MGNNLTILMGIVRVIVMILFYVFSWDWINGLQDIILKKVGGISKCEVRTNFCWRYVITLITMVGAITIILGLTQVLFTDTYIKANLTPVKTIKGVRTGGYITILMGLLFIIFDLITDFNLDY